MSPRSNTILSGSSSIAAAAITGSGAAAAAGLAVGAAGLVAGAGLAPVAASFGLIDFPTPATVSFRPSIRAIILAPGEIASCTSATLCGVAPGRTTTSPAPSCSSSAVVTPTSATAIGNRSISASPVVHEMAGSLGKARLADGLTAIAPLSAIAGSRKQSGAAAATPRLATLMARTAISTPAAFSRRPIHGARVASSVAATRV